jgi:hypothetical protein
MVGQSGLWKDCGKKRNDLDLAGKSRMINSGGKKNQIHLNNSLLGGLDRCVNQILLLMRYNFGLMI